MYMYMLLDKIANTIVGCCLATKVYAAMHLTCEILQLFCWPMTPFIISLPYDHSHLSGSQQFAY